jgi:Pectate lyase superfamily protein
MAVYLSYFAGAGWQFFDNNGDPLSGGKLYTYAAGTTTPQATYTSNTGLVANTNPIILDSAGRTPSQIWLTEATTYKFVLKDSNDVQIGSYDNLSAVNDISVVYSALSASNGSSLVGFIQSGAGAVARTVQSKLRDAICVFDFMTAAQITAVQTNTYSGVSASDITTAAQNALTAAAGRFVYFPAGTYRIDNTLSYNGPAIFGFTGAGVKIVGDGMNLTFFDHRAANKPLIDIDSATHGGSYTASMGAVLSEFAIINPASTAGATGVRILNAYEVKMDHLYIKQMTQDGIEMANGLYVDDGWNMVSLTQMWIDSCARWGIKADGTAGRNEGSYTYLREVFFQVNGTTSAAATPPSGGMIWKGQVLVMESCAFANGTENVGLFIKGESGLGQTVDLRNTTFENCKKRGLYVTGVNMFKGRNLQFYNNNDFTATNQCEFIGGSFTINQVDIDGVTIRATSGNNPCTAFKLSGANVNFDTCRVRNVNWENFDYTGQVRFDGWEFDHISNCGVLVAASSSEVALKPNSQIPFGNTVPLRLRGPANQSGVGVASTNGEWIAHQIANTGIALDLTGLTANTRYYVYLYDNDGIAALLASTTGWTIGAFGYPVKSDNAAFFYVGSFETGASTGTAKTSAGGWLNPVLIPGSQVGAARYVWFDASAVLRSNGSLPTSDTDGTAV